MEIKQYDRFAWDDEIIEATGLKQRFIGDMLPVFRIIKPRPGREKNEAITFSREAWEKSGFKKVEPCLTHPLLRKMVDELQSNHDFQRQLIETLDNLFQASTSEEKKRIGVILREEISAEVTAAMQKYKCADWLECRYNKNAICRLDANISHVGCFEFPEK